LVERALNSMVMERFRYENGKIERARSPSRQPSQAAERKAPAP
jgi:hypothetical protein